MSSRVGIVVVNYNCLDDTLRCLRSLETLSYKNFEVLLIDNCSPDGSGIRLQSIYQNPSVNKNPLVRVILNPENAGFAAANNIGIKYFSDINVPYIWLLNPDTEVESEALGSLVEVLERDPDVGAVGSKILYGNGSQRTIWSAGASIDFAKMATTMHGAEEVDRGQCEQERFCNYLPGCSLLMRKEVVSEIGYLPEEYFMYFEETDWCTKARQHGWKLCYTPKSVIYHHFSARKLQSPFNVYYYNRNGMLFWYRYGSAIIRLKIVADALFRKLPRELRALLGAPSKEARNIFSAHLSSTIDFLTMRFGKRRYTRRE